MGHHRPEVRGHRIVLAGLGFAERIAQLGSLAAPTTGALRLSRVPPSDSVATLTEMPS
jgi:hypothetical protein